MLLEMHAHTREHSPCSKVAAVDLVRSASQKGLDGIILTDHHYLWAGEEIEQLRRDAGILESFVLSSGQEVTTSDAGDVLVYGANSSIAGGIRLSHLRLRCPDAALVLAHPWRGQACPGVLRLFDPNLDAIEVLNRHHGFRKNRVALREWNKWGFVAVAGTDAHDDNVGVFPTWFERSVSSLQEVVDSIRAGACRPFFKRLHFGQ